MDKFTPGPWKWELHDEPCHAELIRGDSALGEYDSITYHGANWPMRDADARLIAEAPAMVEALRRVQDFEQRIRACPSDGGNDLVDDIRAILARIEGSK